MPIRYEQLKACYPAFKFDHFVLLLNRSAFRSMTNQDVRGDKKMKSFLNLVFDRF